MQITPAVQSPLSSSTTCKHPFFLQKQFGDTERGDFSRLPESFNALAPVQITPVMYTKQGHADLGGSCLG